MFLELVLLDITARFEVTRTIFVVAFVAKEDGKFRRHVDGRDGMSLASAVREPPVLGGVEICGIVIGGRSDRAVC